MLLVTTLGMGFRFDEDDENDNVDAEMGNVWKLSWEFFLFSLSDWLWFYMDEGSFRFRGELIGCSDWETVLQVGF